MTGNSCFARPVADGDYKPKSEPNLGVAMWGSQTEWVPGLIRVEGGLEGRCAPQLSGERNRPVLGVGRVDAWITRADVVRKLLVRDPAAFSEFLPLAPVQIVAAAGEIIKVTRDSAIELIRHAPSSLQGKLTAISRLIDTSAPTEQLLTDAVLELVGNFQAWEPPGNPVAPPTPAFPGSSGGGRSDPDEIFAPALTKNQSRVLRTMAVFDSSRLVSADLIAAEMDAACRLSARTIGPIVRRLIELHLAERPEGDRSGARLTTAGRRLASKTAD